MQYFNALMRQILYLYRLIYIFSVGYWFGKCTGT